MCSSYSLSLFLSLSLSRFELVTPRNIYIKSGSSPADQQCCLLPLANRGTFKMEKRAAGEIKKKLYRFPFESCCAFKVFLSEIKEICFLTFTRLRLYHKIKCLINQSYKHVVLFLIYFFMSMYTHIHTRIHIVCKKYIWWQFVTRLYIRTR